MQLVSTDGLTDAQIREYKAATNEETLKSYLNVQKTDITSGASIYESASAETIRQYFAKNNSESGNGENNRNDQFETAVEHAAASASKESWDTFSDEEASKTSNKDWYAKNGNDGVIKAGNKELNEADPEKVKPYLKVEENERLAEATKRCYGGTLSFASGCQEMESLQKLSEQRDKEFLQAFDDCKKNGNCEKFNYLHVTQREEWNMDGYERFETNPGEFKELPTALSVYHSYPAELTPENIKSGDNGNRKFVHKNGQWEVVVDSKGNIVNDPLNRGTFNYYAPSTVTDVPNYYIMGKNNNHLGLDVSPYDEMGNSIEDPTSKDDRSLRIEKFKEEIPSIVFGR